MNINQQMNFWIHLPRALTCHTLSNLVDIQATREPLLTIFSVMSFQKTLFAVILQLPFPTIYPSSWSHQTLLLIYPPINLMFLKGTGQNLTRRNFSLVAYYSLKFTRCSLLVVKSLVTCCKNHFLLVAEVARYKKITRYSLPNSLVTCCRSCSLQKITRHSLRKKLPEQMFI